MYFIAIDLNSVINADLSLSNLARISVLNATNSFLQILHNNIANFKLIEFLIVLDGEPNVVYSTAKNIAIEYGDKFKTSKRWLKVNLEHICLAKKSALVCNDENLTTIAEKNNIILISPKKFFDIVLFGSQEDFIQLIPNRVEHSKMSGINNKYELENWKNIFGGELADLDLYRTNQADDENTKELNDKLNKKIEEAKKLEEKQTIEKMMHELDPKETDEMLYMLNLRRDDAKLR